MFQVPPTVEVFQKASLFAKSCWLYSCPEEIHKHNLELEIKFAGMCQ